MNSTASIRLVLLALALPAGAFVGLHYVTVSPALLFQIVGGGTTVAGLLLVARCDYSARRYYGIRTATDCMRATRRLSQPAVAAEPVFHWEGHTISA